MLDSTNRIEDLIDYSISLNQKVIAITDHETVSNSVKVLEYYDKIKEKNPDFKVILGNEIYLCRNGLNGENYVSGEDHYYHFILLAKDEIGHKQIREISTRAWLRAYRTRGMVRVPTYYQDLYDIIGANPGHVIGSTGCRGGLLGIQLLNYKDSQNEKILEQIKNWCSLMQELFGKEDFFLEMQPSFDLEQIYINRSIIKLSKELSIPFIITTDSHYRKKSDAKVHSAFLKSKNGEREVDSFYASTYLMDTDEIYRYMEESIGDNNLQIAFQNIQKISDNCSIYSLKRNLKIPKLDWKKYPNSENIEDWKNKIPELDTFLKSEYKEDRTLANAIVYQIEQNPQLRDEATYKEIDTCLKDTWESSEANNSRWSAYFLNLCKIVDKCWEAGSIVGPGRGSCVGFILMYVLGITQINPLKEKTRLFRWRFLNPSRVSVLDVDLDIEGGRRNLVLNKFRKDYGEDRVANVLTLGTEKSKSAILTAARALNVDVDIAHYLSSMIESDRGLPRTLHQTFYGDEEMGIRPNKTFQIEMEQNYPDLWEMAQQIEGLIVRVGEHAGGVVFVDEPFTESTALMRAPNGDIITQYELHDLEKVGDIKYDILSVDALDKIHNTIDLICDYGYEKREPTLKQTYEKIIGIYNLTREDKRMWEMCWNHEVISLFQMEKQSGVQGIALTKPKSVDELAILNSVIRLMAQEKGGEQPLNKFARFKKDPEAWDKELESYGLGQKEKEILNDCLDISYGLCITQEQFMQLVQIKECGGFDLTWADSLRKAIAKKNPKAFLQLQDEYYKETKDRNLNEKLCDYVWRVLVCTSKG